MTDEYIKLGLEQLDSGNPHAALRHFEAAYALQPDNPEVLFYLGRACYALIRDNEAVHYYRLLLQIEPDSAAAWMNMANCYDRLFQMEEAEEAYRMASNLDPDNDEVYLEWGIFYYNQERFEAALACYEQALRLNPHNDIALQYQCNSLVMIEHYEEAAEVAESLTLCHPDDWQTWYNRAWCCERLEQYGEVMAAAQKVIQLYPENNQLIL